MRRSTLAIVSVLALGLALLAGCGGSKSSEGEGTTASAANCTPAKMQTHSAGELTVATDKPAYPPYFENDEPENGEGFESAVGYAIGEQLGYPKAKIKWTVEPFDSSYAPGPKDFDFDLNEVSITPTREKAVDFSAPYYSANQAVVALEDSEAAVVDLPTALYLTAAQVENATIVGQFGKAEGEEWGALLAKGSSLTGCVSGAIEALEESGELEKITQRWMSQAAEAPQLH